MARDAGRRGPDPQDPEPTPIDQLENWRTLRTGDNWRDDTTEFPPLPDERGHPPRRRPGIGFLVGAVLVLAALGVSGLAVAGVGPVAHLVGRGDGTDHPAGTSGTAASSSAPASAPTVTPSTAPVPSSTAMPQKPGPGRRDPAHRPGAGRPAPPGPPAGGPGA